MHDHSTVPHIDNLLIGYLDVNIDKGAVVFATKVLARGTGPHALTTPYSFWPHALNTLLSERRGSCTCTSLANGDRGHKVVSVEACMINDA